MSTWKKLEHQVREIASSKWGTAAHSENIAGIDLDAVLRIAPDNYVIIECTTECDLGKIRTDISRLSIVKNKLYSDGIYSKAYIVADGNITPSMAATAEASKITLLTCKEFIDEFLHYTEYFGARQKRAFGSCIDIDTGATESTKYVKVRYTRHSVGKRFELYGEKSITCEEIAELLKTSHKLILVGEYGSGKSRCIREVFGILAQDSNKSRLYPYAINLRDCPGLKRHSEIIRRHFDDLGLSTVADNILRLWQNQNFVYLLDGFDEVSPQSWSDKPEAIKTIRNASLAGARSIFKEANGGVLIAGRGHYFNNNEEMLEALGATGNKLYIISCNEEFSDDELSEYLLQTGLSDHLPDWIPRRPLIWRVLSSLTQSERNALFADKNSEAKFWDLYFDLLSKREAGMAEIYTPSAIKKLLIRLSRMTRSKPANVGPITQSEIKSAFELTLGTQPIDSASALLQRLVGLGRYESESDARVFADTFILDGLRALDDADILKHDKEGAIHKERWLNPLRRIGVKTLANEIEKTHLQKQTMQYIRMSNSQSNSIFISDVLSATLLQSQEQDFSNSSIYNGHIAKLDFSKSVPNGLSFFETVIDCLAIGVKWPSGISFNKCHFGHVIGASSYQNLPKTVSDCSVDQFTSYNISNILKSDDLSDNQKVLMSIIHKTFFQRGCARKEEALFRGVGALARSAATKRITNLLVSEGILSKAKGNEGTIFIPNRSHTERMRKLIESGTATTDPLFRKVSDL